jgi:hypothetical protein
MFLYSKSALFALAFLSSAALAPSLASAHSSHGSTLVAIGGSASAVSIGGAFSKAGAQGGDAKIDSTKGVGVGVAIGGNANAFSAGGFISSATAIGGDATIK